MEKSRDAFSLLGLGIGIGVVITIVLIFVFGLTPQSIGIGPVDFQLPETGATQTQLTSESQPVCTTGNQTGIAGRVVSVGDYLPMSNVHVVSEPPTDSVLSDERGYFLLCDIPAEGFGRKYVVVAKQGYHESRVEVTAFPNKTATANIVMQKMP